MLYCQQMLQKNLEIRSTYGLCPYHYLSTLALVGTQCSILKKVELKFIPDLVHELELKKNADLASMGGET